MNEERGSVVERRDSRFKDSSMATYAESLPEEKTTDSARPQLAWEPILWFGALLAMCYAPVLYRLARIWLTDDDMGHGFFVPIVAGYVAWQRRREIAALLPATNMWGLAIVLFGASLMMLGTLGAQIFVAHIAVVVSLFGVILYLGGTPALRILAFPLFLLLFMIPIPAIIYARITLPLQLFASRVAETILGWISIPVLRDGNVLELASQKLSVAEACSGIRSLLSLSFLSLVYAHIFDKKSWMKWVLLAATIPIAVAANAARVTLTGVLSEYRTDLAQGFFHEMEGWVLFLVALALLVLFHQFVNRIYLARHAAAAAGPTEQ
jgi:exosortase